MHLIIDGYSSDQKILQDEKFLYQLLDLYPSQIGMTKISQPFVTRYADPNREDWGISGFVVIAESHISFHTFVERSYVNIDVFSCRDFNVSKVVEDLTNQFRLTNFRSYLLDRDWSTCASTGPDKVIELCSYEK